MKKINIKTGPEFFKWAKSKAKPDNIPYNVRHVYKNEWKSWGDFLGTESVHPSQKKFITFEDAKKVVKKLNITSGEQYYKYIRSNNDINDLPKSPTTVYQNQWKGWPDFLGKK